MTQYVINIGALPNDGTGDPLRTAFNETNLNFDQVFAAGPVLSNVRIANNTILTTNTNGNLVLAPNGIGRIQANATILPSVANVRDLGSLTHRWNTVYTQNLNATGFITGQFGNITVAVGNLHISGGSNGYVLQTDGNGNLTWTAQTGGSGNAVPAGANTQVQFNNAGSFGGDPDFYFNNTTNTLVVNGNLNEHSVELGSQGFTNLSANVIAQITGNANSYTQVNFQNINSGNRATTDYVATAAFGTDSTYYVNMGIAGDSYDNLNPNNSLGTSLFPQDSYLYAQGGNSVGGTGGNLVVGSNEPGGVVRVIADGSFASNVVATFSNTGIDVKGNINPVANNTQSLGNATNRWANLWLSGNTIQLGDLSLSATSNGLTSTTGFDLENSTAANIEATGNITASAFIGDGSQLTGISGGITFEYAIGNFTANAQPTTGTMQFTNRDGDVVVPDAGTKLFINATDDTGLNTGSTWLAMAQNSERGTVTLQQGGAQLPYRVSNIGVYNTPEEYRGYRAGVNQIWGDDPSINQIIITNAASAVYYNENFDIGNDVFHATNLTGATAVYMVNVYGSDQFTPLSQTDLWSFFTSFVDNVIYQGTNTETLDVAEIRTAFYTNFNNFYNSVNTTAYDRNFRFTNSTTYYNNVQALGEVDGSGARLRVRLNVDYTYTIMGVAVPGTDYQVNDVLLVLGTDIGGVSPDNDITLTVSGVDGNGGITAVVINSGVAAYPWRPNSISDGGDDQYDTGNRINTNLATGIAYAGGNVTVGTTQFGTDSEYAVMYNTSVFCMAATGVNITDLYYSGNLGADSDGFLRWSGLRSPNSAISVQYAYMDCEPGTGDLEPQVGETYQVSLDSGGINLNGFYSYLNDANNDWYLGANRDWRLESRAQLAIQSYSTLDLRTLIPIEAASMGSPTININTSTGSDGNGQFNQQAGSGGSISIRAGDAGGNDNVPTLGNNGGAIEIIAGAATGNSQVGGGVLIEAGSGDGGTAGNLTLRTRSGTTANGAIVLETNDLDNSRFWTFNSAGSTIFPTLTVTRGDRNGSLTGQTLLFGDSTQEAIISTPNGTSDIADSQRFVINPGAGADGTTGEGGDIYLYAGRGGNVGGSGGDIKIRGGLGPVNGDGGYITMEGGEADADGAGGYIEIIGGVSGNAAGGSLYMYGGQGRTGGDANVTGGFGVTGPGGTVSIIGGGSANGQAEYGNIIVATGSKNWTFNNTGNLVLPNGGVVYETNIPFGGLDGNTIALKPYGGTDADQQLLVYPTAGADFNHLHLTSGNLWNTEMFLGNDDFYVKLANTGNVVINTNDNGGNTYQLNFTPFGEMRTTGSLFIQTPNGVPNSVTAITGSSGSWESNPTTDLATTNGTGAGLTVTVTETGGYASAIAIVTPGYGYADGDVITVTSGSSSATFTISVANNQWILDTEGELTLPTLSLGSGLDEQTVIRSQRKLIPPFRWSAEITGTTPTVVYTATSVDTTSMKVTVQIQHTGLGFEMFEVFATFAGADTFYTVSNRVAPPTIDASTVVVDLNGSNEMQITVTINSGAGTSWVTYDAVEFGIPND